jgi:hypothetical protein
MIRPIPDLAMKPLCRYLLILDWGANDNGNTFNSHAATSMLGKRAGGDVMGGAA